MPTLSKVESFEYTRALVHLNAYRSVVDGWSVRITIVDAAAGSRANAYQVPAGPASCFATSTEALNAGRRAACAHLDGN